jgi:hypothetical protein
MSLTDQDATYVAVTAADAASATHMHVQLEDGRDFVVKTGNRDRIAWDRTAPRKQWKADSQPFIFANFLAWSAARREGHFDGPFDGAAGWLDVADEITPVRVADAEDQAAEVRPTQPTAPPT